MRASTVVDALISVSNLFASVTICVRFRAISAGISTLRSALRIIYQSVDANSLPAVSLICATKLDFRPLSYY